MSETKYYTAGRIDLGKTVRSVRYLDLITTFDFTDSDPWFQLLAEYNEGRPAQFAGRKYLEFGIGGGLQAVAALKGFEQRSELSPITNIAGVDIDSWRLDIAAANLKKFSIPSILYQGDAVQWIANQQEKIENTAVVMCLPQAPLPKKEKLNETGFDSTADTYHEELLPEFARKYNRWGLGLNAAVLGTLINHIGNNTDVSAVFSGRVPEDVIRNMINELGWKVVDVVQSSEPIQQDPDTDIAFVSEYANESYENLFYEKNGEKFIPISANEAEARLQHANKKRDNFNVYHYVAVWHLEPIIN